MTTKPALRSFDYLQYVECLWILCVSSQKAPIYMQFVGGRLLLPIFPVEIRAWWGSCESLSFLLIAISPLAYGSRKSCLVQICSNSRKTLKKKTIRLKPVRLKSFNVGLDYDLDDEVTIHAYAISCSVASLNKWQSLRTVVACRPGNSWRTAQ